MNNTGGGGSGWGTGGGGSGGGGGGTGGGGINGGHGGIQLTWLDPYFPIKFQNFYLIIYWRATTTYKLFLP